MCPARLMVLTLDDLPAQRAQQLSAHEVSRIMKALVELLESEPISAIGFVNENKLLVDLETALDDSACSSADTCTGSTGITWLHRWAHTRGVDRSFFHGEPTTAEWVQAIAGIQE